MIFVNSLCPWDKDFFVYKEARSFKPMDLSEYTRSLLNVDNRDDDEIFKLYELQQVVFRDERQLGLLVVSALWHSLESLRVGFGGRFDSKIYL